MQRERENEKAQDNIIISKRGLGGAEQRVQLGRPELCPRRRHPGRAGAKTQLIDYASPSISKKAEND
jgi:hypothetical protein